MVLSECERFHALVRKRLMYFEKGSFYRMGLVVPFLFHHRRNLSYPRLFILCNLLHLCLFLGSIAENTFLVTKSFVYIFTFIIFLCSSLLLRSLYYSFLLFLLLPWFRIRYAFVLLFLISKAYTCVRYHSSCHFSLVFVCG